MIKKYTELELQNACKNNTSFRDVLGFFDELVTTNHVKQIKSQIIQYNIDVSHFINTNANVKNNDELFVRNSSTSRTVIRKRILKDGLIEYKCALCGCDGNWNNTIISLQLDHIDGDSTNNELSNLIFLCPNCHASTETFAGKNMSLKRLSNGLPTGKDAKKAGNKDICPICNTYFKSKDSSMCTECALKLKRKKKLSADQLNELFDQGYSVLDISKMQDVAEGTVRHWMYEFGVKSPQKR